MIKNYLLLAFRNLKKQKTFTFINIAGLTVGITCCLMIFLFVQNEFSYDNFHKQGDNIYRVMRIGERNGSREGIPYLSPPYATALKNEYPDAIKRAVRVMPSGGLVSYKNQAFTEKRLYYTDSDFFELFNFPLLKGTASDVLMAPGNVVLTESVARKYFGDKDPIGQVITLDKELQLKVTGIAKDLPVNSHLSFDMVVPISNFTAAEWFRVWNNNNLFTYVELNSGVNKDKLVESFPHFMDKYMGEQFALSGNKTGLGLTPVKEIYFESAGPWDNVKHGNKKVVYIFIWIGFFILFIACINFINLATARAAERAKEVGLRKVLGAVRRQLVVQFMAESFVLASISCILSLFLLQLLMPVYTSFLSYSLPSYWANPSLYLFMGGIVLVVGVLAGSYPALLLSSFLPIDSLKGKLVQGKGGVFFRKTLVVFQFSCTVLLIIGMMVIRSQMEYVRNKDLGFNREQALVVRLDNEEIWNAQMRFKSELEKLTTIKSVSMMSGEPGGFHDNFSFELDGKSTEEWHFRTVFSDFQYLTTLGLKLIAGRDFSADFPTDSSSALIVNRETATKLGLSPQQALGKQIRNAMRDSLPRTIIGVVENFHFLSLRERIEPMVIAPNLDRRVAVIRLNKGNPQSAIGSVKQIYSGLAPVYPFEFEFLDQQFNDQYQTDVTQQQILGGFSAIAIFIACMGLFGLASYTAIHRTKEIGVRKVLGSSIQSIVFLLSKDLLKPVLLGTAIAIPLGYMAMSTWLENFAYRTSLHWWVFGSAAMIAILIALMTVSWQAIKAAHANPVKSLRNE